jgi:hypothetical protein
MAFTGIDVYAVRKYVSPNDPDKENPTVFALGALDARMLSHLKDIHTSAEVTDNGQKINMDAAMFNFDVVRFGLKGFENFIHPQTGNQVKCDVKAVSVRGRNYETVTDPVMDLLSPALITELAQEIFSQNQLSVDEEKN